MQSMKDNRSPTIRSLLFVPGDSERKLQRAVDSESDALILDLEDSISTSQKPKARELVSEFLKCHSSNRKQSYFVRVNPYGSEYLNADLNAVVSGRPDGILLPKSEPAQIRTLCAQLSVLESAHGLADGAIKIIGIATETPSAIFALGSYGGTSTRLRGLAWGAEDLAASLGALTMTTGGNDDVFRLARALCLLGASAAGVDAFDTVYVDYKDLGGLEIECLAARRAGFAGKLAIHPGQIRTINMAFSPTQLEIEWAKRVVAAFDADPELGTAGIDGKMVDRPHLILARSVLARHSWSVWHTP
jgi:citrate lyase subunit beta / citryl-CoA lyase